MDEIRPPISKLIFDRAISGGLVLVTSPVSLVIAIAIAIDGAVHPDSRGGLLHTEVRVSAGHRFTLYKFRILKPKAEQAIRAGAKPKRVENDPQNLTAVGRILKKFGLDELPQFFNVLTGEMSLVGPRPKPVKEYEEELEEGNHFRALLRARPHRPGSGTEGDGAHIRRRVARRLGLCRPHAHAQWLAHPGVRRENAGEIGPRTAPRHGGVERERTTDSSAPEGCQEPMGQIVATTAGLGRGLYLGIPVTPCSHLLHEHCIGVA